MTLLSAHSGRDFAQGEVLHESPGRLIEGQPECIMDDVFATTQILWEDEAAMTQTGIYIYIYGRYIYIYIYGIYIYIYKWDIYGYMGKNGRRGKLGQDRL